LFEWCWRRDLPAGRDDRGKEEYAEHLADVPARFTLERLPVIFEDAIASLLRD
jgi:hypothetical protein